MSSESLAKGGSHHGLIIPYTGLFEIGEHEVIESDESRVVDLPACDFYEFITKDIHFIRIAGQRYLERHFLFRSSRPYVSLIFAFKCRGIFVNSLTSKVFADVQPNQSSLTFINTQVFENTWKIEADSELYIINLEIDYFRRFLSSANPMYETFQSSLKENTPVLLNDRSIEITPRMKSILNDMFLFEHKSYYKALYLRSKFMELLMLQFQEYEASPAGADGFLINESNFEKMKEARDIIDSNIAKPCTLLDLAQQVGTNECYLKKHFKQAFGTTVFGYLHKQRMEKSRELLLSGNRKISQVAKISGYKHASHFSTAFKKYFRYLPTHVRILIISVMNEFDLAGLMEIGNVAFCN